MNCLRFPSHTFPSSVLPHLETVRRTPGLTKQLRSPLEDQEPGQVERELSEEKGMERLLTAVMRRKVNLLQTKWKWTMIRIVS